MQNLRKTNETGRSMVEMLGVLAIIGVLSVAGVAWFHPGPGWNNSGYLLLKYEGCGWPYDGKVGKDSKTCCKDGKYWHDYEVGYFYESEVCQGIYPPAQIGRGIFNIKTDCRPIEVMLGVALADRLNHWPNNAFLIVSGGA